MKIIVLIIDDVWKNGDKVFFLYIYKFERVIFLIFLVFKVLFFEFMM